MEEIVVPIDKAGRVVLPKAVRDELAIDSGDLLRVYVRGNEVTLRPQKAGGGLVKRGHALVFTSRGGVLDRETVNAVLASELEVRNARGTGRLQSSKGES
jgi:AbrB family looped-hinge helix DNA binding protein